MQKYLSKLTILTEQMDDFKQINPRSFEIELNDHFT